MVGFRVSVLWHTVNKKTTFTSISECYIILKFTYVYVYVWVHTVYLY